MAKRAFLTSKALNFMYKIRTEEFIQSTVQYGETRYTTDLIVDKHPEYPDIPPSTWTVTLFMDSSGNIQETVQPKDGPTSLKNPSLILVEWVVRMGRMGWHEHVENDPNRGDYHRYIGPEGLQEKTSEPLSELIETEFRFEPEEYGRSSLNRDPHLYVLVSLTFMVETSTACRSLERLYESRVLADCQLVCGGRDFSAHRALLAAQSPVFAAMFQNDMKEKSSGICTIQDIAPDVMEALVQFVYTGEVTKANGQLEALWTAADRYDMQDLKQECVRLMLLSITDDNALDYLNFAAQRGLSKLKVEAAKVISRQRV